MIESRAYFDGYLRREMVWMFRHQASGRIIVLDGTDCELFHDDEHEAADTYYEKLLQEAMRYSDSIKEKIARKGGA